MGPAAQVTPRAPQSAEASAAPDTETHEQTKDGGVDQRPGGHELMRRGEGTPPERHIAPPTRAATRPWFGYAELPAHAQLPRSQFEPMATEWTPNELAALTCVRRAGGNQERRAASPDSELRGMSFLCRRTRGRLDASDGSPTSSRPWSAWPGELNALKAINSQAAGIPGESLRNQGRRGSGSSRRAGRSAHGRICRALPVVNMTIKYEHFDLQVGMLVARAHKCRHLAASQTFDRLGQPAFHRVLESLPCGPHIEPLAVLEQRVLEPAVSAAHQDDDEVVVDVGAALRRTSIAVLLEQLHEPGRNLLRETPAGARRLIRFDRHDPPLPGAVAGMPPIRSRGRVTPTRGTPSDRRVGQRIEGFSN